MNYSSRSEKFQYSLRVSKAILLVTLLSGAVAAQKPKPVKPALPVAYIGNKLVYAPDSLGNRIPDFSYCGYKASSVAIPFVPVQVVVPIVVGDATQKIQAAINQVANLPVDANGFRGAVLLQKGIYQVMGQLKIEASGIVIRGFGAGSNGTKIIGAGTDRQTLIRIAGKNDRTAAPEIKITNAYVPVNAVDCNVEKIPNNKVGLGLDLRGGSHLLLEVGFNQYLQEQIDNEVSAGNRIPMPLIEAVTSARTEYNQCVTRQQKLLNDLKVKRSESGMIIDPITLLVDATIGDALKPMRENKIGGIPVVDNAGKLVGILTNRDLRFETDYKKKVKEVMTKENLIIAPEGTDLRKAEKILRQYKIEKLPVVSEQGKLIGLITYRDILQLSAFPNAVKDKIGRLLVGAALGITKDVLDRAAALQSVGVDIVTLDSAHGHSKGVIEALKLLKKNFKNLPVIAGNVATAQGALALANAGADAVKIGIGPGSICTTRIVAGAGVPQLTAIMEATKALKGKNVPIIADGGIRYTGDMVKALAAGANCVMMGSIFAGTEESPGETIIYEGRKFKSYRGMGSIGAMNEGSSDRYFQGNTTDSKKFVPEGIEGRVAYKGTLSEIVYQFVGGLKAGMGYCGAKTIKDLQNATFVQITNAGMRESHAHDIDITKEAPNYSRK